MNTVCVDGYIVWIASENKWHWLRRNKKNDYVQFLEFYHCDWVADTRLRKDRVNWVTADFRMLRQTKENPNTGI